MMKISYLLFVLFRKIYRFFSGYQRVKKVGNIRNDLVEFYDQDAQNLIYKKLLQAYTNGKGFMICKFGTYELNALIIYLHQYTNYEPLKGWRLIKSATSYLKLSHGIYNLHHNAGVFPETEEAAIEMAKRYYSDIPEIDILASYQLDEKFLKPIMSNCKYVNLDGFFSPFMYELPWTRILQGKKVLVIHPFAESMKKQYAIREKLFDNPQVLPAFKSLSFIKAVQSAAGSVPQNISSWKEALKLMEKQIDEIDFEFALIGCGAYGLPLAAYIKRKGKIGIHLASMTQVLFGIYGNRWAVTEPQYKKYINRFWVRPMNSERPVDYKLIENSCYW